MNRKKWILGILCVLGIGVAAVAGERRMRVIDFEDELVEGINKRPLGSLSQISERDRRGGRAHLYRKRVGYRAETAETLHELRYIP